jgi:HEAT repeat protein
MPRADCPWTAPFSARPAARRRDSQSHAVDRSGAAACHRSPTVSCGGRPGSSSARCAPPSWPPRSHPAATGLRLGVLGMLGMLVIGLAAVGLPAPARAADAPGAAVDMVVALLGDADPVRRAIGLEAVRHGVRGAAATRRFAELLAPLDAPRQAELLSALAERGDTAAVPAVATLLGTTTDTAVRAAALRALGALGRATEVPALVAALSAAGPEQAAAVRALQVIGGPDVPATLRQSAGGTSPPPARAALLRILAERRDRAALPIFVAAATAADAGVRTAALEGLARLGGAAEVNGVVAALLAAPPGGNRDAAERTLVAICTTAPGHEAAAPVFLARFRSATDAEREALLPALARVGGTGALEIVNGLVADTDAGRRRLGLKALSLWPDAAVAGRLLDLLGRTDDQAERQVLVDGLIRIAPRPDNGLDDAGRLDLLRKTMELCRRDEDRARVLERANAIRVIETLRFVVPYLDDPGLAQPACLSVVELAHHQKLREDHKPEFTTALDRVMVITKNPEHVERAEAYKAGKTWERKKR